jgi:hypothetical protein
LPDVAQRWAGRNGQQHLCAGQPLHRQKLREDLIDFMMGLADVLSLGSAATFFQLPS